MKTQILESLDRMPYFTIEAVKQLLEETSPDDGSIRTTIYRWAKAGHIIRLKKGVYMTRRFFEAHRSDEEFASMVSAILIPQSYLSLEYILQRNNILTDITYPITAVTLKQTRVFENKLGTFSHRNIKPSLYHGFTHSEYAGIPIAKATLAKALFDYLYLRKLPIYSANEGDNLAEKLRLNLDDLAAEDQLAFAGFVEHSQSEKMERVLKNLKETVWQA
jgi:predicted transcriptional regulator of viral defense system